MSVPGAAAYDIAGTIEFPPALRAACLLLDGHGGDRASYCAHEGLRGGTQ